MIRRPSALVAALLAILTALVVLPSSPAYADGPQLTLAKGGTGRILAGGSVDYSLTATNPSQAGAVPEYNVSFRDELPVGVTYRAGSTRPEFFGEPTVVVDPVDGHQTLLWINVTDLPAGAQETLSFSADVDSAAHPVGATISNVGDVYGQTDPRTIPKFDAAGDPVPSSFTESATSAPSVTTVTAITITKAEGSPESELLRGVHNHPTVYTLTVRNSPAATTGGTVVDYLPAGMEFLSCGDVDNGSGVEYAGAPPLDAIADVTTDCRTPSLVETVLDPPGKAPGIYTRVEWTLGTLAPGAVERIRYAAGIPQRENTMTFAGGTPTPASLDQAANLDNNTGPSTRELGGESTLRNYAEATGTYTGPVVTGTSRDVSDSTTRTVSIEDVALQKSVAPAEFNPGGVATYTLQVSLSEYADASDIVLTDHLPDGLCPLSTTANYAPGDPTECDSGPGFDATGASFAGVVANADGSYDITFTPLAADADGTLTVTYQARMRTVYGSTGLPTVSGDGYLNTVSLVGVTAPAPGVGSPDTGPVDITDESSASLFSDEPGLVKLIQPDVTPYTCSADPADYVDPAAQPAADVVYDEGSRVCFRLRLDFSTSNSTRNPVLTDFLPEYLSYEAGSAEIAAGSQPGTLVSTEPLRWEIGTTQGGSRFVPAGGFFEVRIAATVTTPAPGPQPDITANLAKSAWQNTDGSSFGLRDQLDLSIQAPPPVTILKAATRDDDTPLADGATVVADELLRYSVTVGNSGTEANENDEDILGPDVWDVLPAGVTCAEITAISDSGVCTDPGAAGHPTFAERATRSAIRWDLPDSVRIAPGETRELTYTLRVPTGASVDTTYTNTASVASFATETNRDTLAQHHPADNVDTTTPAEEIDVPAATDTFTVVTPPASVTKSNLTSVTEASNGASDAVIGELVTYTVDATVPADTSVYSGVLADPLPAGLTFVSATAQRSVDDGATFGALPGTFTLDATNGTLTFPAAYATGPGQDHVFRVTIVARVANVGGNTHGTDLVNTATLTSLSGPAGTPLTPRRGSSTVTVVTPSPTLAKSDDDGADKIIAIGQTVTYTLTSRNAAGRPPAHDMFVVDCVPAAMQVVAIDTGSPSQGTATFAPSTGGDGCAAGETRVLWNVGDLAPGASQTLSYAATLAPTATGGLTVTNTATQTSSTLDDDKAAPGDADNPDELVFSNTASDTLTVRGATTTKSVAQPSYTIGERATYTVQATLPAGVNFYDAVVTDVLPAGLDVGSLQTQSVTCAPTCSVPGTPLTSSGTTVGWSLGDVLASPESRTVTIVYSALVADVVGNVRGTPLTNGARVRWNLTDGPDPTSAGATFDQSSATATATVTVTEPVLSIDKTVSDTTPEPGEAFTYTVAVTNSAAANVSGAHNVTVVDTVPVGVVVDPLTISNGGVLSGETADGGGTITWTLGGPIGQGVTRSLTYDATLASPTLTAPLTNTADITRYTSIAAGGRVYDGPEDTATVTAALPFVEIDKAVVDGGLAYLGEAKTWRITVTSSGAATAYGVDVDDVLPPNWTYDAGSAQVVVDGGAAVQTDPSVATAADVQTLGWTDLADLPVGDAIVITFTATPGPGVLDDPGVGGTIDHVNSASTTAEDADGNQGPAGGGTYHGPPDTAAAHIDAADVSVDKTHTGVPVAGQPFSWSVTVANDGPDTAVGPFTVTDTLPGAVTGGVAAGPGWTCSTSGSEVTCTRTDVTDTLAPDASFPVITVTVDVPAGLVEGTVLTNAVEVADKTYDPDLTNNQAQDSATVDASADLTVDKALVGALVAGSPATYTLDVTNLGPSVSRGQITVTDTLPAGSSFVSADGTGWTCSESAGVVTCTRPGPADLGALPQIALTVDIPADQLAPVRNEVSVEGPQDDNPANDDDAVTTDPGTSADLALEKESTGELVAGEQGAYRFTVTNNGPSDAQSPVRITDSLPAMLTYVDFTSVTGAWTCSAAGQDVTCTLTGALADEGIAVVDIAVDVDSAHTGPITNTATVTSATPDPNDANNTDDDDSSVTTRADLSITKSHTGPVVAGQPVTYDLVVSNNGPSLSPETVTVTDTLPAGMTYAGSSGAAWTCTATDQVVTCDLTGALASRTAAPPLSITADVAPDAGPAPLVNAASVDGPLPDPDPDNNNTTDPADVVDLANLTLVKSVAGANPVTAGEQATFEIVVTNDGPSDADTVVVSDALPAGLTLVSADGSGWTCSADAPVTCSRDTLGAGLDAPVITVVALVGAGVPDGTQIVNSASVTTTTPGDDPDDNADDATLDVIARADLVLAKSHPSAPVAAGTSTTFTIEVRNAGPSDAVGPLVVTDTLPEGLSYLSASGGWTCDAVGVEVTCTLPGDLLAGASAPALGLTAQIDATVDPQDLTNVASVTSSTVDPTPGNNTDDAVVAVVQNADLAISKSHDGIGLVGEELVFTLEVSNTGPSEANAVTVTDSLPAGLDFVSAEGAGWSCVLAGSDVTCELTGPLAPDTTATPITLTVLVQANAYPGVVNVAEATSAATDPNPLDNVDTDTVQVAPLVNLTIDKRHEGDFKVGEDEVFTLEVTNEGPTPAPGPITVTDTLPAGLTFVAAEGAGWTCAEVDGTVTCEHGELAVDEVATIELVVRVGATAYPSVTNVASVASDSTETDETDNADEDPVTVIPLVVLSLAKELVSVTGSKAVFDLTVTNEGPNDTVEALVLTDTLPRGLDYVSASGRYWSCDAAGRTVTCIRDEPLAAGADSTVRLVTAVTADPGSDLTNSASVAGGGADAQADDAALVEVPEADQDGAGLADTGGPPLWLIPLGVALLLGGTGLLVAGARRRGSAT